jgi:hypothetical protein
MPLTAKGEEIKSALTKEYGAEKGEEVLYAGKNKGTFTGIDCDNLARIADAVNNLAQRFDAMVDAEPGEYSKKFKVSFRPAHGVAPTQGGPDKHIEVSAKSPQHAVKLANSQVGANWQRYGVKEI